MTEAVNFIKQVLDLKEVTLAAIDSDSDSIVTGGFAPLHDMASVTKLTDFIDTHNGKRGLYFGPNKSRALGKKAKLTDIESVEWLVVDKDPRAICDDLEKDRARILKSLQDFRIPPTAIVDSGNGYQAYWKLAESIQVGGDEDKARDAGLYSKWLAAPAQLNADHCHSVDHLYRLPGTTNVPNARKRAKGRVPVPATLVFHDASRIYSLETFEKAPAELLPAVVATPGKRATTVKVTAAANFAPRQVPDFETRVSPHGQMIRMHADDKAKLDEALSSIGVDARYPEPSVSMNEVGHAYIITLVNADYSPDEIAGDVMDPADPAGDHYRRQKNWTRAIERSIKKAMKFKNHQALVATTGVSWPDGSEGGTPFNTYGNTQAAILEGLRIKCSYDLFRDKMYAETQIVGETSNEYNDRVVTLVQDCIYKRFGFYPKDKHVANAIVVSALTNSFNPLKDYLEALDWDGTERLDRMLIDYLGAPDTPYVRAVSRKAMIAQVRRAVEPGCKVDSMPVLESIEQGIGKSLFCADLAGHPDLFTDQEIFTLDSQGQQEALCGKWVNEMAELSGMRNTEIEKVKASITRTHDRGRPAYGRTSIDCPRTCMPWGTTNDERYLRDQSGNRRFWPVKVVQYDRKAFLKDREQLLAEAAHYEAEDESLYLPEELAGAAKAEQRARMVEDGWPDLLRGVDGFKAKGDDFFRVSSAHLLIEVLGLHPEKHTDPTKKRLAAAMRSLGWEGPKPIRINEPVRSDPHDPTPNRKGMFQGYTRAVHHEPLQIEMEAAQ